ncbi:hypothetical protein CLLI_22770 [Clostridium liquoris]|jgi:hypothetical protein|uniref:Uncharacterized protein n=1 Tax=Clostridium liquoris TaxID=1289519 RepID=A0A2T0B1M8_9CLOT|nr:hypothetical protein [Clostridium liquoris]PRR77713.1 hypothetical protein CLLI_22770 [Clostridium liquoris]
MLINAILVCFTATRGYDFSSKKVTVDEQKKIEQNNITNYIK